MPHSRKTKPQLLDEIDHLINCINEQQHEIDEDNEIIQQLKIEKEELKKENQELKIENETLGEIITELGEGKLQFKLQYKINKCKKLIEEQRKLTKEIISDLEGEDKEFWISDFKQYEQKMLDRIEHFNENKD